MDWLAFSEENPIQVVKDGDVDKLKTILMKNPKLLHMTDDSEFGRNLLHHAVVNNRLNIVKFLLSLDSGLIDLADNGGIGMTAFQLATHAGHVEILEYLIQCGANFGENGKRHHGLNPVAVAGCGSVESSRMRSIIFDAWNTNVYKN